MTKSLQAVHVVRGTPARLQAPTPSFCLPELVGRFVELSGEGASAVLTSAVGLVLDAQRRGEPAAWVTTDASSFYPPDLHDSGVDLESLVVIRVSVNGEPARTAPQHAKLAVAAERLLRSGAFGLVVIDLGKDAALAQPLQSRLLGLAQRHQSVLLCLTEKHADAPSLGSLVSLRAQARRKWLGKDRFECQLQIVKDKQRGPTWSQSEVCRGPLGLR